MRRSSTRTDTFPRAAAASLFHQLPSFPPAAIFFSPASILVGLWAWTVTLKTSSMWMLKARLMPQKSCTGAAKSRMRGAASPSRTRLRRRWGRRARMSISLTF